MKPIPEHVLAAGLLSPRDAKAIAAMRNNYPVYDSCMRRDDIHRTAAGPGLPKWGWYNVRVPRWLQWKLHWAKLKERALHREWLERMRREP